MRQYHVIARFFLKNTVDHSFNFKTSSKNVFNYNSVCLNINIIAMNIETTIKRILLKNEKIKSNKPCLHIHYYVMKKTLEYVLAVITLVILEKYSN